MNKNQKFMYGQEITIISELTFKNRKYTKF